jgi:hypothetical protein
MSEKKLAFANKSFFYFSQHFHHSYDAANHDPRNELFGEKAKDGTREEEEETYQSSRKKTKGTP